MRTCDRCFDGRHVRCEDRHNCACTVCPKREPRPKLKRNNWSGPRSGNGRTLKQQAHYTELQRQKRRVHRGDPDWFLDKDLLKEKIFDVFKKLEFSHKADIQDL